MTPASEDCDERLAADVEEFAMHDRKGGWARALLVARRVEPGESNGVGFEQESTKRSGRNSFRRISAREFARRTGTSPQRILAFYDAWCRAAEDGIVPPAGDLSPGVHVDLPDEEEVPFFGEHGYYRSYQARMKDGDRRQAIEQEAERAGVKPTAVVYVAQQPKALKTAVLADDTARTAAEEAIEEYKRRQAQAGSPQVAVEERGRALDRQVAATGHQERDAEAAEVERAVRAVSSENSNTNVALTVFTEMTQIRLGTLRVLSLLQGHQVQFTDDRRRAIADLCDASQAAIAFIRDLAASPLTALNDDALRAFLDESEKKLG
ncbi:hypothetical protein ACWDPF_09705 [Streptomyces albogriseolus]